MKKSKLKVFYSHGMGSDKKDNIEFFRKLLKEKFDVLEGEEPTETTIHKATLEKIDRSDFVFAVFSKRDELKHKNENNDEIVSCYKIPPGVIYETGYSKATSKLGVPVYVAIEKGIPISSSTIGMVYFDSPKDANSSICIWSFPPDIKELNSKKEKKNFRERFINIEKDLTHEMKVMPYSFLNIESEETIYRTGYSSMRYARTVQVKHDELTLPFSHEFGLELDRKSEYLSAMFAQNDQKLLDNMKLYSSSEGYRKNVASFSESVVEDKKGVITSLKIENFKINKAKTDSDLLFSFNFNVVAYGIFHRGDEFTYEYILGIPDVYFDTYPQGDIFNFPSTRTNKLVYKLNFEKGFDKFKENPSYYVLETDGGMYMTELKSQFDKKDGAGYTTLMCEIETKGEGFLPKARVEVAWTWQPIINSLNIKMAKKSGN